MCIETYVTEEQNCELCVIETEFFILFHLNRHMWLVAAKLDRVKDFPLSELLNLSVKYK